MSNLSRTASQFFINLLFIFILTMTMYSFFRALGALCSSLDVGMLVSNLNILGPQLIYYPSYTTYRCCNPSTSCVYRYGRL